MSHDSCRTCIAHSVKVAERNLGIPDRYSTFLMCVMRLTRSLTLH